MSENLIKTSEYRAFIQEIKQRIQTAQIKAAIAVNQELLHLLGFGRTDSDEATGGSLGRWLSFANESGSKGGIP